MNKKTYVISFKKNLFCLGYVSEYYENKVISPNNTKGISEPIKINVRSTDDLQEIPRGHQNPPFQPFQAQINKNGIH